MQPNRSCRSWRQINMSAAYEGTAIVDPHDDTPAVAHPNEGTERPSAMRRRHSPEIQMFALRCARSAKTVRSAIDAGHFGVRNVANDKT
jgi:hypothetical protein